MPTAPRHHRVRRIALPAGLLLAAVTALAGPASAAGSADSDHDGMPNRWERVHKLNAHSRADARTDLDHDRVRDGDEDFDRDGVANEDEDDATETCVADDDDVDRDHVADEDENELHLAVGSVDSDRDGVRDGDEDFDRDGRSDEDEDDDAADRCSPDRDHDGVDDEDRGDRLGTITSFDAETGVLVVRAATGRDLTGRVTADTEIEHAHGG